MIFALCKCYIISEISNIFDQYVEYFVWRKNPKESNTFACFVKHISIPKNQNEDTRKACEDIKNLTSCMPIEIQYSTGISKLHNEVFYYSLHDLELRHWNYDNCRDYKSMKIFYYSNSIVKYLLKNIAVENLTGADFHLLFKQVKRFEIQNEMYDEEIKYYTKHKVYKALKNKYPEYAY